MLLLCRSSRNLRSIASPTGLWVVTYWTFETLMNSPACTQFVKSLKSLASLVVIQRWENEPRKLVVLWRGDLVPGDISSLFPSGPLQTVTWCQMTPFHCSPAGPCRVWFPRIPGLYSIPKFHDATLDSLVCGKFTFIEEVLGGDQGKKKSLSRNHFCLNRSFSQ